MKKSGKRWLGRVVILWLALLTVGMCGSAAGTVKLNKSSLSLLKGKTYTLKLSGTTAKVKWSSSKTSVATVSSKGKVTAKKKGTAVITATAGGKKYKCKVTVKQPVTSVALNQKKIAISVGKTYTLKATVKPTSANDRTVTWSSSDKAVVKVSSKGKLTAVAPGSAVITAKAKDGSDKKATCQIVVKTPVTQDADITTSLDKTSVTLEEGETITLKVTTTGNAAVAWGSSAPSVVSVSAGKLTAKKAGTATIAVLRTDGKGKAFCTVTVTEKSSTAGASENAKKFLAVLQKYSDQVKSDAAKGIVWSYSNDKAKSTWSAAVKQANSSGITYCNCALLARWALREMKVIDSKNFWGLAGGGIQFRGDVETQLKKYCDIIKVYKTPAELLKDGDLLPGDICTWVEYQHTNVYAGDGLWYDAGRGVNYTDNAFTSFGPSAAINMSGTTVGYIIRFR